MKTTMTAKDYDLCPHTQTRREACACGSCTRKASPEAKHRTNKRDVLALIDCIAGCIDNHPSQIVESSATWSHVGSIAHLRGRLVELATGFALSADMSEEAARCRVEKALDAEDEHVDEALIDAVMA
ncbi:MAG: hypothetical protein A2Z99_20505 [Treponema sp. GWB1_62_6]|nr:MAG: hypothetical protein A2Z99_20505 [Treponema sp. GWB1_62_6]